MKYRDKHGSAGPERAFRLSEGALEAAAEKMG